MRQHNVTRRKQRDRGYSHAREAKVTAAPSTEAATAVAVVVVAAAPLTLTHAHNPYFSQKSLTKHHVTRSPSIPSTERPLHTTQPYRATTHTNTNRRKTPNIGYATLWTKPKQANEGIERKKENKIETKI